MGAVLCTVLRLVLEVPSAVSAALFADCAKPAAVLPAVARPCAPVAEVSAAAADAFTALVALVIEVDTCVCAVCAAV